MLRSKFRLETKFKVYPSLNMLDWYGIGKQNQAINWRMPTLTHAVQLSMRKLTGLMIISSLDTTMIWWMKSASLLILMNGSERSVPFFVIQGCLDYLPQEKRGKMKRQLLLLIKRLLINKGKLITIVGRVKLQIQDLNSCQPLRLLWISLFSIILSLYCMP